VTDVIVLNNPLATAPPLHQILRIRQVKHHLHHLCQVDLTERTICGRVYKRLHDQHERLFDAHLIAGPEEAELRQEG